jgi:hypothetical protein
MSFLIQIDRSGMPLRKVEHDYPVMSKDKLHLFKNYGFVALQRGNKQRQKRNAGISPLRRAMRLRDFGRDDSFFTGFWMS